MLDDPVTGDLVYLGLDAEKRNRLFISRKWFVPWPGTTPSVCPNCPNPPSAELLLVIQARLRAYELIRSDQTFHWKGAEVTTDAVCICELPSATASAADPHADLRKFAHSLSRQERIALEAICDAGGVLSLKVVGKLCGWDDPIDDSWNSLRQRLNKKLTSRGWRIRTKNQAAHLTKAGAA
jgi:hypothetical protein